MRRRTRSARPALASCSNASTSPLRRPTLDDVYLTRTGHQASGTDPQVQEATR
ncbi:MAG: hypothetical protein JWN52_8018 [Actinomycetia bacterium]|nr:hypothetical protein [Actinomycetes bacterium]